MYLKVAQVTYVSLAKSDKDKWRLGTIAPIGGIWGSCPIFNLIAKAQKKGRREEKKLLLFPASEDLPAHSPLSSWICQLLCLQMGITKCKCYLFRNS